MLRRRTICRSSVISHVLTINLPLQPVLDKKVNSRPLLSSCSEHAILAHMRHVTPPPRICNTPVCVMLSTHAYLRSHPVTTCSQFGIDTHRRLAKARMEECPPGGDYASGEDDPSESDNPPAGEQAQGSPQGESKRSQLACCVFSRNMTHISLNSASLL